MLTRLALLLLFSTLVACSAPRTQPVSAADVVDDIADRYYAWALETVPEQAYFAGIHVERHDGLQDLSPAGLALGHVCAAAPGAALQHRPARLPTGALGR